MSQLRITVLALILGLGAAGAARAQEAPMEPESKPAPKKFKPVKPEEGVEDSQEAPDLDALRKSLDDLRAQERKLRQQIADLERSMGDLGTPPRSRVWLLPDLDFEIPEWNLQPDNLHPGWNRIFRSQDHVRSFSVEHGPDGKVKIEVRTKAPGGEDQVETYEADSAEDLMEKHPELAEKHGLRIKNGGIHFESRRGFDRIPQWRTWPEFFGDLQAEPFPAPDDRLGVMVADPDASARERFDLDEGEGLLVQSVTPDSMAARLGVKDGDVLLTINGRRIEGPATIRNALRATKKDGTVTVEVGRGDEGAIKLSTTRDPPKVKAKPKRERA